ncbi:hypothetical protein QTG56_22320 (plasmid) [Rossellomorea sp. AcN35-11]|nr:hypothetical protein [Rossellomorea aquimaris]WJV32112.1 hypothetical protein QTG56_22320 [Rossellomorea sp. AcN35-11]
MLKPIYVNDVEIAFGGNMVKLLPTMEEIPSEYKNGSSKWNKVVGDWFFCGLKNCKWEAREGVETKDALNHIKAIMSSFDPKHEHKEAGCAYLLSCFFHDVSYEKAK